MRSCYGWFSKTLIVLVALACTEGILYNPLCWSESTGYQLDWAASHAVIKPLPSFRSFSGIKHKLGNNMTPQKTSSLTPAIESPHTFAAVATPITSDDDSLSELRPLSNTLLPKTYHATSTPAAPLAPLSSPQAPQTIASPSSPAAPAVAATAPASQTATPAVDPAMLQQMMLMNMLGSGGLSGNNGNNTNSFNPMALMQLMQMQQGNPSNGTLGSPSQNIDPEMIQTMLMGQLMNNMDFTGSKSNDDR